MPKIKSARDLPKILEAVLAAIASGEITPTEGAAVAGLIEGYRKALESEDLDRRITELENLK